jgi:hypothetical protein
MRVDFLQEQEGRNAEGRFMKGYSGNLIAGPPERRNKATKAAELLLGRVLRRPKAAGVALASSSTYRWLSASSPASRTSTFGSCWPASAQIGARLKARESGEIGRAK